MPRQRVNEEILAPRVRLIDVNGEQLGIVTLREALNAARERSLDLIEVAPTANPPVCKILDYGKYQYLQMKKQREARKSQKVTEVKEVRFRPKIGEYDAEIKLKQARRFLTAGMKVKVRIQFRGREITHPEIGRDQLREIADQLSDLGTVEQFPNLEGRFMTMVLAPLAAAPAAPESRGGRDKAPAASTPDKSRADHSRPAAEVEAATDGSEDAGATEVTEAAGATEVTEAAGATVGAEAAEAEADAGPPEA